MAHHGEMKIGRTDLEGRAKLAVETRLVCTHEFDLEAVVTFRDGFLERPCEHEWSILTRRDKRLDTGNGDVAARCWPPSPCPSRIPPVVYLPRGFAGQTVDLDPHLEDFL